MTRAERAFRAGYHAAAARPLSEIGAPRVEWGWMEWIGLAAVAAFGAIYGAPYLFAAAWIVGVM